MVRIPRLSLKQNQLNTETTDIEERVVMLKHFVIICGFLKAAFGNPQAINFGGSTSGGSSSGSSGNNAKGNINIAVSAVIQENGILRFSCCRISVRELTSPPAPTITTILGHSLVAASINSQAVSQV